jgi:hypothetical protein
VSIYELTEHFLIITIIYFVLKDYNLKLINLKDFFN